MQRNSAANRTYGTRAPSTPNRAALFVLFFMVLPMTAALALTSASGEQERTVYLQIDYYVLSEGAAPGFVAMQEELWRDGDLRQRP